jgi:hypothetical protein
LDEGPLRFGARLSVKLVLLSQPLLQFGVLFSYFGVAAEVISKYQSFIPMFATERNEV